MASINTNLSAMTALQSLKTTQNSLSKTQGQISTGLRVGEASHNASYWSIATQMKSDNGALGAVKDSISQSKAMIDTFSSALDKTLVYLNKMKEGLVAASQPGADLAAIQTEIDTNLEGLKSAGSSATFNGQNWLMGVGSATDVKVVTSYDGNAQKVGQLTIDTTKTVLFAAADGTGAGLLSGVMTMTGAAGAINQGADAAANAARVAAALTAVDDAINSVTTGSATLGANKALLETQESFIGVLSDSLTAGVSAFVDADMNEASTRLQ
ncbi:flagellin N-terminal helical domain-containing protein, partial [Microvirga sp. 2TAF3]|uniref:flagellin N-terminal helical domain-containing protein n=1 Tax=Microvirga sp. 2TAF3 TaxID=3233014 RepID=UPI003F9CAEF5